MRVKSLKYSLVYIIPALFAVGVFLGGWLTFAPLLFAFGVIPLLELIFNPDGSNADSAEQEMRKKDRVYDVLLYLVPVAVYSCAFLYVSTSSRSDYSYVELVGLTLSLGVLLGGLGINVSHELGHRQTSWERTLGKILLLPSFYMHFYIEHNFGHHRNVSTHEDPASARFNESVYHFWARSVVYSYLSAWKIEMERLSRKGLPFWSLRNEMLVYQFIQLGFAVLIALAFGANIALWYAAAALIGVLLLETVNYIEHYGLTRKKVSNFRYERVTPVHSWNSNHIIGRLMLFELSRHSDHHYQPAKKYQLLEHHDHSPQMPTGYPGMMLLSLVPPLWFVIMNHRVEGMHREGHAKSMAA